ncbi:hypothetical protein N7448_000907 [Penicillium atrosanguineum]|uniref:thioredoxin-dependent peroxiredoxin n=1 Tax=Penicillium atrosanguineum TaxID=1132637 RepID=A0A9W9HKN0_9EURO|nr:uncharacterized protein N7443_004303 [Penicillium atrosanguineum]KAJ5134070.1 hypothetical protein N7526_005435 [Penicillium atrosanguineum]KAJ5149329.1 hypothetical protein N7448_000907 [Penicillium atrosanguineum]KAJ5304643.1 hypothetical protein N7443_004303 [Penicillium atrosanguineum]KAJ5324109.1 hypothetical protein N7476_002709 [Penicillium atrosanguineum]
MVELRKRKAQASVSAPTHAAAKKSKPAPKPKENDTKNQTSAQTVPQVDNIIDLEGFGGEIETNDGTKTSLKKLVDDSTSGVVLFTYPKASTPGCTKQACLFRDNHKHLTSTGLSIYGLSADSTKANTTFKTKQKLSYPLLCDSNATLIGAIGLKKSPKGTTRGVFVVDKKGKVLLREAGGPDATVDAVEKLVAQGAKEDTQDADTSEAK